MLRGLDVFEEHAIRTTGDAVQDRRLADIGGKGLFAKEIHEALADGRIDFAVHSLKDLETELPPGIVLACTLPREDARDALILGPDCDEPDPSDPVRLPAGRRAWWARPRCGARRNCCTRGRTCASPRSAAMCRPAWASWRPATAPPPCWRWPGCGGWGWRTAPPSVLDPDAMVPAAGQGIIGITMRADDTELHEMLAAIEDPEAKAVSTAERAMLAELDGSCRTPIGGHARLLPSGQLHLTGLVARADGSFLLKRSLHGGAQDAARLGTELGASLRADSPRDIFG